MLTHASCSLSLEGLDRSAGVDSLVDLEDTVVAETPIAFTSQATQQPPSGVVLTTCHSWPAETKAVGLQVLKEHWVELKNAAQVSEAFAKSRL